MLGSNGGLNLAAALTIGMHVANDVHAQTWPTKAVRLVVPAPAGSAPDFMSRLIGQKFSEGRGQAVIIDNVVGASRGTSAPSAWRRPRAGWLHRAFQHHRPYRHQHQFVRQAAI